MKTIKIFTISILVTLSMNLSAQFKVYSDGSPYMKGHIYMRAYEGDGNSGTAYLQARDKSGSSSIGLQIRTQKNGSIKNAMHINSDGNVGIGRSASTSYKLGVEGNVLFSAWTDLYLDWSAPGGSPIFYPERDYYFYLGKDNRRVNTLATYQVKYTAGLYKYSDKRLKKNIEPINSSLNTLLKLKGCKYDLIEEAIGDSLPKDILKDLRRGKKFGLIAQDVKEVIPEIVTQDESTELFSIDYVSLIPILIEAIKEQQTQIEQLSKSYKSDSKLKSASTGIENLVDETLSTSAVLYQNAPNPFSENTEIKYFLPEDVKSATLYIYNMQGNQIKSVQLHNRGEASVTIYGSDLQAGMYIYALIADGKEIDSKRMILTD